MAAACAAWGTTLNNVPLSRLQKLLLSGPARVEAVTEWSHDSDALRTGKNDFTLANPVTPLGVT